MKKILIMSLLMAFTISVGVTSARVAFVSDSGDKIDAAEQARLLAEFEKMEALKTLTSAVKPVPDITSFEGKVPAIDRIFNAKIRPRQRPVILTDYLNDDFSDGDYTANPAWTMTSNGNGNGAEDWAIRTDPWSYAFGDVQNDSSGYMVGSDSDGGAALADEELSISFNTPGGGGELTLYYWLHFRAYLGEAEYFEVLVDSTVVDLVVADSGYNPPVIVGDRTVILDAFNDGASHTLTMHYYADWGYVASFDDIVITDDPRNPCVVDCPANGILEGEPDCSVGYDDIYNSGCNIDAGTPPFVAISCGDTICGKSGVYRHANPDPPPDSSTFRDTDWYRLVLTEPSVITWSATAEFPFQLLLMDAGSEDCVDYEIVASAAAAPCDTVEISEQFLPGVYWLFFSPSEWNTGIQCDGNGAYGNDYVAWLTCDPTPPCQVNTDIGDINSAIPYADLGNTTLGAGHDYDGASCIGPYWNSGEDYVYEFTVSSAVVLDIILDPMGTAWTSITLDDFCPPDEASCLAKSTSSLGDPHGFTQMLLLPGTYWLYCDSWSAPDNYDFNLYIIEGVLTVGLGQTGNIPDCGVSNFGKLGDDDSQGNTYGWNANPPANYAGTFVMGDSPTEMFAVYNEAITDCYQYSGVTGLNLFDPFHPTARYNDDGVLGGLSVEYGGFGYNTGGNADDIFVHAFKLTNNSGTAITDFYAGVYFDWDIDTANDTIFFDWANNMMVQAPLDQSIFYGMCVANAETVNLNSMTSVSQQDHIYPTGPDSGGWKMDVLYGLMSTPGDSIADSMYTDMSSLLSTGPYTIADGDSVSLLIAIIGGASLADVQNRAQIADTLTIPDFGVEPPPPPLGRCCYVDAGDTLCTDNLEPECTALGGSYDWNQFLNCTDFPCVISGCDYVAGDVNGSTSYNGLDITFGVAFFKGGTAPMCDPCALCPDWYYCGDVNGSCSYNGLDITYGVAYFKGGASPIPCGDCPPIGP